MALFGHFCAVFRGIKILFCENDHREEGNEVFQLLEEEKGRLSEQSSFITVTGEFSVKL